MRTGGCIGNCHRLQSEQMRGGCPGGKIDSETPKQSTDPMIIPQHSVPIVVIHICPAAVRKKRRHIAKCILRQHSESFGCSRNQRLLQRGSCEITCKLLHEIRGTSTVVRPWRTRSRSSLAAAVPHANNINSVARSGSMMRSITQRCNWRGHANPDALCAREIGGGNINFTPSKFTFVCFW